MMWTGSRPSARGTANETRSYPPTAVLPPEITRVLVVGAGLSGVEATVVLCGLGYRVLLSDNRGREELREVRSVVEDVGAELHAGPQTGELIRGVDLVIKSPGVPAENPVVAGAYAVSLPVWSEVELAYRLLPNSFTAVTGTNGKTTTTALLGHIFRTAGHPVQVLGNIGEPVMSVVGRVDSEEELVVELSSFQLEDVHEFRPAAGILLNVTPDHLDRHRTMERYFACKRRLFARQGSEDSAVLNLDDEWASRLGEELSGEEEGPRVSYVSAQGKERAESYVKRGKLFLLGEHVLPVEEISLRGPHNMENCLAAGTAALRRGVSLEAVRAGLRSFPGIAHRLQKAGIVAGVEYVNDSKATNVQAALKALAAYPEGVHVILGGRDKGSDYDPLVRACARGVRGVYLIGEAAPLIARAFRTAAGAGGNVPVPEECGTLGEAVRRASVNARRGEVVLLTPACSSFDQFRSFEERGDTFVDLVRTMREGDA